MSVSPTSNNELEEDIDKKIDDILVKWKKVRDLAKDDTVYLKDLARVAKITRSKIERLIIQTLNKIMNVIKDNFIFKDELMDMFRIEERDFNLILKKSGLHFTETKVYKNIKIQLLLRLDPMALDLIDDCIPYYGANRTAIIRQMIIEFFNNHFDDIQKTKKSH
ncbi:MAG: hypothetical protein ACTSPY_00805 [Candidatus Helarchaeota archaeon]